MESMDRLGVPPDRLCYKHAVDAAAKVRRCLLWSSEREKIRATGLWTWLALLSFLSSRSVFLLLFYFIFFVLWCFTSLPKTNLGRVFFVVVVEVLPLY